MTSGSDRPAGRQRLAAAIRRFIEPRPDGLPPVRLLVAVPALLLLAGIVLVAVGVNGWSSGVFYSQIATGHDPDLIGGQPQRIRSDEWNVQTVWAIAQIEQGLPVTNETFPGGMDATLPQDLPRADWTVVFRPHLWGFLFLDADHAFAFKWWVPALALLAAGYCFVLIVLPRRPIVAVLLSVAFYYSPLFQWWFLATTIWPAVWALVTIAAVHWALHARASSRWGGASTWVWAGVGAFLTIVMAMGIYAPYIIPVVLVTGAVIVGMIVQRVRGDSVRVRTAVLRVVPVVALNVVAAVITVAWLASKASTVRDFLSTSYPGTRLTPTGSSDALGLAQVLASSFVQALGHGGFLGQNSSEASGFFLIGFFLLPVVIWLLVRSRRRREAQPWVLVALVVIVVVFVAYLYLPGWDPIAHLLFLDRTTSVRLRIGLGLASFAILVFLIREWDARQLRAPRWLSGLSGGTLLLSQAAIAVAVFIVVPKALGWASLWWLLALLSAAAIVLVARRRPVLGAVAFALTAAIGGFWVNPVYLGVLDLRQTPAGQAVESIDRASPDAVWVGVGGQLTTATLVEAGAEAYNGFQGAPNAAMWKVIDPHHRYEFQWNRLAGVSWRAGSGEPTVVNPASDQILASFDACSSFAQRHVQYVLSDRSISSRCLTEDETFDLPKNDLTIYQVVPAR